jgi:hypothetical protein
MRNSGRCLINEDMYKHNNKNSDTIETQEKNGYTLSKQWFDFAKENPESVKPIHAALYFWIVALDNKLRWPEVFGLPTLDSMKMIGIKDRRLFRKSLSDLTHWGFIKIFEKSINQYHATRISLSIRNNDNNEYEPQRSYFEGTHDEELTMRRHYENGIF